MVRKIAVVTGSRAEYGILYWLLKEIQDRTSLELQLLVTGTHLSPEFGMTVQQIEEDGFPISERLEILLSADTDTAISTSVGLGVISFAKAFKRLQPDVLVLLGDRYETLAAAVSALVARIPVGHIGGGHSTEGAIDESMRNSISKMSHLHFASRTEHRDRIVQLGEQPDRVFVTNTPLIDGIMRMPRLDKAELEAEIGFDLAPPVLLVVYHPVTLEDATAERQMDEILLALSRRGSCCIFIMPNADTGGRIISQKIRHFVESHPDSKSLVSIRRDLYLNLMRFVSVLVGNSSSGIIEAASFELPVVNIGNRQRGRTKPANVIDVGYTAEEILTGIQQAVTPAFRKGLKGINNPYGSGQAGRKIVGTLRNIALDQRLLAKVAA